MDTMLEVFTTRRSRRDAHRQWPDEVKGIVSRACVRAYVGLHTSLVRNARPSYTAPRHCSTLSMMKAHERADCHSHFG
jgi:hypothetical protein